MSACMGLWWSWTRELRPYINIDSLCFVDYHEEVFAWNSYVQNA